MSVSVSTSGASLKTLSDGIKYTNTNNDSSTEIKTEIQPLTLDEVDENLKTTFSTEEVKNKVNNKLGSLATNFPFQPNAKTSKAQDIVTVTEEEFKEAIGSDKKWNSISPLQMQSVDQAGTYILGSVSLADKAKTKISVSRTKITLFLLEEASGKLNIADTDSDFTDFEVKVAETLSDGAFFMNENGEIIDELPDDGNVIAVAPMKANTAYIPVITLSEESNTVGSSGTGCSIGVGAIAFAILASVFFKKH